MAFQPAPEPTSELGRYRILSPKAGIRVSPLCLGAMSIGDAWNGMMGGGINEQESFELLDEFYKLGGNFIDTANNYQNEQSETFIGNWMESRDNRDDMVIATKATTGYVGANEKKKIKVNYCGNSTKSIRVSVDDSLKKLKTNYIDLLYIHWWDFTTSVEELMGALNDLVRSGKVLYLGISDTPAWIVAKCNEYAKAHGFAQFVVYQGKWSCNDRDLEMEVVAMCHQEGLAIAPWNAMGGGKFKTQKEVEARKGTLRNFGSNEQSEQEKKVSAALEKVAKEVGVPEEDGLTGIALAWIREKVPYVFPIIGGRTIKHLQANVDSLKIQLTEEQIQFIDSQADFKPPFPYSMIGTNPADSKGGKVTNFLMNNIAHMSIVESTRPIGVKKAEK